VFDRRGYKKTSDYGDVDMDENGKKLVGQTTYLMKRCCKN